MSEVNFGYALQKKLEAAPKLVAITNHGDYSIQRDEKKIGIGKYQPNVTGILPFVGWNIITSDPLIAGEGAMHWHKTTAWIFAVTHDQLKTSMLADAIMSELTNVPEGECHRKWFFDISDDSVFNRHTTYTGRRKFGSAGTGTLNIDGDFFEEAIEAMFVWRDFPCEGMALDSPDITECPLEDTEYDNDCKTCE